MNRAAHPLTMRLPRWALFIVGAGFSRLAGLPLTNELLPLMRRIVKRRFPKSLGVFDRGVRMFFPDKPLDQINLEELLTLHECKHHIDAMGGNADTHDGSRYMIVMRMALTDALSQHDSTLPRAYNRFAELVQPGDIVMTFNWDTLIEESLTAAGKPFRYTWGGTEVKVLKMHGSVSWKRLRRRDFRWFPFPRRRIRGSLYRFPQLETAAQRRTAPADALGRPFIVLPSFAKLQWLNTLRDYWYKIAAAPAEAAAISIIGYSLRPDDFHARSFLMPGLSSFLYRNRRKIRVIDPSRNALDNYSFLPPRRIEHCRRGFDENSVAWLAERLRGVKRYSTVKLSVPSASAASTPTVPTIVSASEPLITQAGGTE